MKKSYLLLPAFLIGTAFAQQNNDGPSTAANHELQKDALGRRTSNVMSNQRVPGDVVYSETFGDPFNDGWTTSGAGSDDGSITPAQLWLQDFDGPNGFYSIGTAPIASTTLADGFMIMDGGYANGLGSQPTAFQPFHAELVSPVYDLTAQSGVNLSLKFEHYYRTCCSANGPLVFVDISTDGFSNVATYAVDYADAPPNTASGTRTHYINITNDITGNLANVQVRFRWGENGGTNNSNYYWMVDDMEIIETFNYHGLMKNIAYSADTTTFGTFGGFQRIPSYAAANTTLWWSADLSNIGAQDWTNANLTVLQDGSAFAVGTPEAVSAGSTSSLLVAKAAMPTALASYDYTLYGVSDNTFDAMDTAQFSIEVTVNEYSAGGSVSTGTLSPSGSVSPTGSTNLGFGGQMVFTSGVPETIKGMNVVLIDTIVNQFVPMQAIIEIDGQVYSQNFTVDNSLLGQVQYVPFDNEIQINGNAPGTIDDTIITYLIVAPIDGTSDPVFVAAGDDTYHIGLRAYYDAGGARVGFFIERPAMMDVVIDPGFVSIKENEAAINSLGQNVPNPFDNNTIIKYNLTSNQMVSFQVIDVTGKVVKTMNLGSQGSGQHTIEMNANEFNKGIYFYTLTAGDSRMTKKMVVTK